MGGGAAGAAMLPVDCHGAQLELFASITYGPQSSRFGFLVLASDGEYTQVGYDLHRSQIYVDRTRSGSSMDADIRAGPWYGASRQGGESTMHMYVDHSLVTLIVDNRTALSVWVHPTLSASVGVALFADAPGVIAQTIDVWQLQDAQVHQSESMLLI